MVDVQSNNASLYTIQHSVTLISLSQDQKEQLGGRVGGRCAIFALDSPLYFIQSFFCTHLHFYVRFLTGARLLS